jgi:eukaryotic-like serine/threonine-protein kinase
VIGTKIGFYEITRQLGQGGMGAVYLAEHSRIGNRKVVKVLLPEYSQNEQVVRRFENEAKAAARLNHRNIIKIDDFGLLPNGQWYILMPHLEGSSLDAFLESHGKLSIHQTLHILVQVCSALEAAHGAGIIHRDLKPANVFLTQDGDNPRHAMLLDFGIAKVRGVGDGPETQTGAVFGTPVYMAAEQFEDASRADAKSDLFALGVMAYQMVSGTLPFGSAPGAILYNKQITTRPPRPTGIPFEWAEIILRTLAVRPVDRPASARAFAVALAAVTPGDPPFEPSGVEILASVARELITEAPSDAETVKNNASEDRGAPVLWAPGRSSSGRASSAAGLGAAAPPASPPPAFAQPGAMKLPHELPGGAPPFPAAPTTLSAMSGHRDSAPPFTAPSGRRGRWRWVAGSALAAGAAVVGLLIARGDRTPTATTAVVAHFADAAPIGSPSPPPAASTTQVPIPPPPTAAPAAQTTVVVTIDSVPTGAALSIDGKPIGNAPQTLDQPVDHEIEIRAELGGRAPAMRTIRISPHQPPVLLRLERAAPTRSPKKDRAPSTPKPFDPNDVSGGA